MARGPDPDDRRAVQVRLTKTGRELHGRVWQQRSAQAEDFFAVLSAADRFELSRILDQLLEAHPRSEKDSAHPQ
ncbi:MAG: MarR family winged helix-turn-helix transcriptional regulator [Nesterenkonia sp.]